MAGLKLVSVNVERSKHLDRVLPFITRSAPDVLCVQELNEHDVPRFSSAMGGGPFHFSPMLRHIREEGAPLIGVGIFSRFPDASFMERYYVGRAGVIPDMDHDMLPTDRTSPSNAVVVMVDIDKEGVAFRIATTHFTWSPRGEATDEQRRDMRMLLALLEDKRELVLCGDFNAPRRGEMFAQLAARFHDTIPPEYETSIDITLHRNGKTRPDDFKDKMVDGLFTTPRYRANDVELCFGVSDHAAISATIDVAPPA